MLICTLKCQINDYQRFIVHITNLGQNIWRLLALASAKCLALPRVK